MKLVENKALQINELTPPKFESLLWQLYEEMNEQYCYGACQVLNIRLARFKRDFSLDEYGGSVTFGMYESENRTIYVNFIFRKLLARKNYLNELRMVLWHEMCHAMMINATTPARFGQYRDCCGGHTDEYWSFYRQHPLNGCKFDEDAVSMEISKWMLFYK